jgi:hypothetical protein
MAYRDVGYEDGRDRSRSRHRDRSRSRRRDGESEKDWHRRKRDRHRRDTMGRGDEDAADRPVVSGDQSPHMNALGIQQLHPGQGLYAPVAPPVTSASGTARYPEPYPSTSRAAGARSPYPAPGHPNAPTMVTTISVSGSRHRDALQNYGAGTSRAPNHIYRPSSTPTGPVLSSWTAPDLSNPSLNSLGLSAPRQGVNGSINSQAQPTARDSVSSWGTADSLAGPTHGDLFSSLRPLASAPADSGLPASDLLPREDGHLLGVVRVHFSLLSLSPSRSLFLLFFFSNRGALPKSRVRDHNFHRLHCSQSLFPVTRTATQIPARAPVALTIRAPSHKHRSSQTATPPSTRHRNLSRPRIVGSLTRLLTRGLSLFLTSRLAQPPRDLYLNLTLYRRSTRLSPTYQLRSQLLRFHVCLISPFSTVLPCRNHRTLAIAQTIDCTRDASDGSLIYLTSLTTCEFS